MVFTIGQRKFSVHFRFEVEGENPAVGRCRKCQVQGSTPIKCADFKNVAAASHWLAMALIAPSSLMRILPLTLS
ncbi:MAG: hypothetical protein CO186_06010 [Zetaproteobacteria bacterium CG_4_9_14_3_um_filter_49_83]|nr:MAG: hypothetical protein AUJ56_03870 [Zetaproteobacteria bacterium CG1_02_49_23]PIQ34315.1 MAG: hypothetical protein COW62_02430 [Zetaproteobacteria bacterium CG17_big_fil_post_rev_8_21_14_2_50_50_13]PIV29752.1 MAG: hypothetical protein COS35_10445 [Zetaproteobacteria bacterium CG02_land_8_20_14_3_00_50_9]PIY57226.1 MAG: hypothetical protein COZ00_00185 [Zetaproteobacteria bacterium CG_4_10_14_0_8_um_filter_49_80]PJA35437.1 MAG: hypothetical protein CO186_06010 [Zetaproteobacteria bacterium